jgi:hypothetical protein
LLDRLKNLFSGNAGVKAGEAAVPGGSNSSHRRSAGNLHPVQRPSNGLEQFFSILQDRGSLALLDFAGASQENISFITSFGHQFASEDFVRSIEQTFGGPAESLRNQTDPLLADQFVSENLNLPPDTYDGVLAWDGLQFLTPHLLQIAVDRLYESMRPDGCLLAFFNANEKAREIPLYNYRIADPRILTLVPRGSSAPAQYFNNRSIEKLFHRYSSVKFFLARDHLREIIVRR